MSHHYPDPDIFYSKAMTFFVRAALSRSSDRWYWGRPDKSLCESVWVCGYQPQNPDDLNDLNNLNDPNDINESTIQPFNRARTQDVITTELRSE